MKKSKHRRNVGQLVEKKEGIHKTKLVLTDKMAKELAIDLIEMAYTNEIVELSIVHETNFIYLTTKNPKGE